MESIVIDIENIQGEAPAKEPKAYPTVSFTNVRHIDHEAADEAIQQAFDEGCARAMWLVCQRLDPVSDRVSKLEDDLEELHRFLSGDHN